MLLKQLDLCLHPQALISFENLIVVPTTNKTLKNTTKLKTQDSFMSKGDKECKQKD